MPPLFLLSPFRIGMNAAVRAVVRVGIYTGAKVYFVHEVSRWDGSLDDVLVSFVKHCSWSKEGALLALTSWRLTFLLASLTCIREYGSNISHP